MKPSDDSAVASPVTADNFNRAESDTYFQDIVRRAGGVGRFFHRRQLTAIDDQGVIRANRDTLYSAAVFDLDAGSVIVTLPDAGKRFMSMIVIDEDQYALHTVYAPGSFTYARDQVGTRYVLMGVRTFIDPGDPKELERVHALQDAIKADQEAPGVLQVPRWDPDTQKRVRDALIVLAGTLPDTRRMFGPKDQVDPVRHLIGTATGWGGNAEQDAIYLTVVPARNDGRTVHTLTLKGEVPVDGFWSISVYNKDGYFEKNELDAYTLNSITAKKGSDGAINIQFGGCEGKVVNCLPIMSGWNYWVRLYRPRAEILEGRWSFPQAQELR
jgi:hypothetical protein